MRLEPIILELEREQNDLLIIAHESVLRVLYGYLMACNACEIPMLKFPRNEIIEIIPASYSNEATRIVIHGCLEEHIPDSPEGIEIPVPPSIPNSGKITPMGIGTPVVKTGENSPAGLKGLGSLRGGGGGTPAEPGDGSLLLVERALRP